MSQPWWSGEEKAHLGEIECAMHEHAPRLRLVVSVEQLVARGAYELSSGASVIDRYMVELQFDRENHSVAPRVWETGGRIPRIKDFHVNPADGTCCLGVYDEWLARTGDASFAGFLQGPFRNFFLSQTHFRLTGKWPFGDRPHGLPGMIESYSEILGSPADAVTVGRLLSFLAIGEQKGHWQCPCGSGAMLRKCCREEMKALGARIGPKLARGLLANLQRQMTIETAGKSETAIVLSYAKQ